MPGLDQQALQSQAFQVLDLCILDDERPAPLRILSFTSDSYDAIKAKENKKRDVRRKAISQREDNNHRRRYYGDAEFEASCRPMELDVDIVRACDDFLPSVASASVEPINVPMLRLEDETQGLLMAVSPLDSVTSRSHDSPERVMGARRLSDDPHVCHFDYATGSANDFPMITVDDTGEGASVSEPLYKVQDPMGIEMAFPASPSPTCESGVDCSHQIL